MARCAACGEENPDRARFCLGCGRALTVAAPAAETRKTVTILFADVAGSTALGERLDPEALRSLMGRYFATMERTSNATADGREVHRRRGHGRVRHPAPSTRTTRCAPCARPAQIRDELADLNEGLERDRGDRDPVPDGVYTGEVVAGDPGPARPSSPATR